MNSSTAKSPAQMAITLPQNTARWPIRYRSVWIRFAEAAEIATIDASTAFWALKRRNASAAPSSSACAAAPSKSRSRSSTAENSCGALE